MSDEKRSKTRQVLSWPGVIIDIKGSVVSDCKISNVLVSGAKLTTPSEMQALDEFILSLGGNCIVQRNCIVVWTSGRGPLWEQPFLLYAAQSKRITHKQKSQAFAQVFGPSNQRDLHSSKQCDTDASRPRIKLLSFDFTRDSAILGGSCRRIEQYSNLVQDRDTGGK
jgi:hypothetical protein